MAMVELGTGLERRRQHDEKFHLTWILVKCRQCAALANVKKASLAIFIRPATRTFSEERGPHVQLTAQSTCGKSAVRRR